MKKLTFQLILVLTLLLPLSPLDAQPEPPAKRALTGDRMSPSDSYFFVEGDGFWHPLNHVAPVWQYFYNLSIGYQKNDWLGLGLHFNRFYFEHAAYRNYEYAGFGLSYRMTPSIFELRVNAGLISNFYTSREHCSYDPVVRLNPYFNAWAGFIFEDIYRIGVHFSFVPPTVQARSNCYYRRHDFPDLWMFVQKDEKVGVPLHIYPSIGFTAPLFRSGSKNKPN